MNEAAMNPEHYVKLFTLDDGRSIRLRAISPDDKQQLLEGFHELSEQSIYSRFFSAKQTLDEDELNYLTELDFNRHVGIGAALLIDGKEIPAGVGRYIILPGTNSAEVSITVKDAYQHRGIGKLLFQQLVLMARSAGITRLIANVLPANRYMLALLEHSGLRLETRQQEGVLYIKIDILDQEVLH